ncbi:MAG: hypothetical protein HY365_00650 [Candidatus Aenigmarchaeota archaeon]|nr:hypothetical protein [Candidatus Aenigmarchaeota archaeon]
MKLSNETLKFVFMTILLLSLSHAAQTKAYVVELNYDDKNVSIGNIAVMPVYGFTNSGGDYRLDVVSFDDKILYTMQFAFPLKMDASLPPPDAFDEQGKQISFPNDTLGEIVLTKSFVLLYVPYFVNAMEIRIYDSSGTVKARKTVVQFADTCGNAICEAHESYESCRGDCRSGSPDDYCDSVKDGTCDPDCTTESDTDCAAPGANKTGISLPANVDPLMLAGAAILVLAAFLYYAFRMAGKSDNLYN